MAKVNNEVIKLSDYPIKFDNTPIPFPTAWTQVKNKVETSLTSEGGTDLIQGIRKDKLHVDCNLKVANDDWVKFFAEYDAKDSFTLKQYNPLLAGYEQRTVRLESFQYSHIRKSEGLTSVTGVWDISFTIEEF